MRIQALGLLSMPMACSYFINSASVIPCATTATHQTIIALIHWAKLSMTIHRHDVLSITLWAMSTSISPWEMTTQAESLMTQKQVQTASDQLTLNQPSIHFMLFWNSVTALDLQSCVNSITPFYSHKNKWPKQLHLMNIIQQYKTKHSLTNW